MNKNDLLDGIQMQKAYGAFYTVGQRVTFKTEDVPVALHALIPYAQFWGISDDWNREDLVEKAPREVVENLKHAIKKFYDILDEWLGGAEASNPNPSDAYVPFSAMRMAAYFP